MSGTANEHEGLPFGNFWDAADTVLRHLFKVVPMRTWMVARDTGDQWMVMRVVDRQHVLHDGELVPVARAGVVAPGDFVHWSDAPPSTPVLSESDQESAESRGADSIVHHLRAAAYIGVPILHADGRVFGTLCGIDPEPLPESLDKEFGHVQMFGRLLSTILANELRLDTEARQREQLEMAAFSDELTGLPNRRAWTKTLDLEQTRVDMYGHPTTIFSIDVDGLKQTNDTKGHKAGDQLLRDISKAIKMALRSERTVARVGGDEFAILCVDCNRTAASFVMERLRLHIKRSNLSASIGAAPTSPKGTLMQAWEAADAAMYEDKQKSRQTR
jgi:diguanylate cyclase (GGDEF)-like protein